MPASDLAKNSICGVSYKKYWRRTLFCAWLHQKFSESTYEPPLATQKAEVGLVTPLVRALPETGWVEERRGKRERPSECQNKSSHDTCLILPEGNTHGKQGLESEKAPIPLHSGVSSSEIETASYYKSTGSSKESQNSGKPDLLRHVNDWNSIALVSITFRRVEKSSLYGDQVARPVKYAWGLHDRMNAQVFNPMDLIPSIVVGTRVEHGVW